MKKILGTIGFYLFLAVPSALATVTRANNTVIGTIPFNIPQFTQLLSFLIQLFFVLAGLAALFMLLLGALQWVVSGGDKEGVDNARKKIVAALVGLFLIVAVVTVIITIEQVVFRNQICLGISCELNIPSIFP